jgi:hypothetical protein
MTKKSNSKKIAFDLKELRLKEFRLLSFGSLAAAFLFLLLSGFYALFVSWRTDSSPSASLNVEGENFLIENDHPQWLLGVKEGRRIELEGLVAKYLGENGYLFVTLTSANYIDVRVSENFPIKMRGYETHARLGMVWEGATQHVYVGPEGESGSWGEWETGFYPSFDVFHLLGKEHKDDEGMLLTLEEWDAVVSDPLFTLEAR